MPAIRFPGSACRLFILYFIYHHGIAISLGVEENRVEKRDDGWAVGYGSRNSYFYAGCNTTDLCHLPAGLFVMGTGLAILQTASNPYVTIMGPQESAASTNQYSGNLQ